MKDHPEIRKEVFAWFGSAAYFAQCFEVELCILHLLVRRLKVPSSTPKELDELDEKLSKKTMGVLLQELAKHFKIHPEFQSMLYGYRDRRNYLMHHFFPDHSVDLLTRQGCLSMIDELKNHCASLKEADRIAQAMSRNVRRHLGISEDELQALVKAELHSFVNE